MRVLDMLLIVFKPGHGNPPLSGIMRKGGSTFAVAP